MKTLQIILHFRISITHRYLDKTKNLNGIPFILDLQVILGLLFPPFIKRLDFKSKEELQQMPQTEEEHLENQNLDYEDQEKQHPDAEVLFIYCLTFRSNLNQIQS